MKREACTPEHAEAQRQTVRPSLAPFNSGERDGVSGSVERGDAREKEEKAGESKEVRGRVVFEEEAQVV